MKSSRQLFIRRVFSDWGYQYRALRTAVDWIIALYFVIPLLLVVGYQYYSLWQLQPAWFSWIPLPVVAAIFYLFAWLGTIRYFVEEGDQLFLRQNESWFKHLMVLGWRYSLILQGATTLLLMIVFLPLLVRTFNFTAAQVTCLFIFTYLLKINLGLARQLLALHLYGIVLWLVRVALFAGVFFLYQAPVTHLSNTFVYSWIGIALLLVLLVFLSKLRLRQKGAFFADIARERDSRMRIVSIMLIQVSERKRRPARKRPIMFGKSQRLFRGTGASSGLSDFLTKSFFRNGTQWKLTIQFVLVMGLGLFFLPEPLKIIVWIAAACLLAYWRKLFCKEELSAPFLKLFDIQDNAKHQALQAALPVLVLPALLLISLCVGISFFTWWGPLLMLGAAIPLAYGASSVFTSWY
ncbi:ABC transporter permease [Paenibacillus radicis (ex Xue et al. 2023)]|uniref:ABC transporter permease n=1 Tax=Paenibacillus radicis (ex Xue et al. 2023) TaxID=2972489 RepID=A0ABT1YJR8_9BACL|nr:ABC transporter permease [Paenibacillus radicis (ex Xue et al. 2023)]MCR8632960.1 ABC transporter permease [Paenibacillus radicis (ex Xue et al. 2023)]